MRAIVLSGGGSKGSYQIGVWKALRKLNINYDIVTGTSVGALNGALMVQNKYHKAYRLWKQMNMSTLFGNEVDNPKNKHELIKIYRTGFLKTGGMEVVELQKLINKYIHKDSFFRSKINYGLVTVNVSGKKALQLEKKNINKEKLSDYLIASASCYPAFQAKDIDGNKFIDGGMFDNLPINLAVKLGADEIIAVDLCAPGIKQKVKNKNKVKIITIKPHNKLSNFLNFNEEEARINIKYGYCDTMKVFHQYYGIQYTFKEYHFSKLIEKYKDLFIIKSKDILHKKRIIFLDIQKVDDQFLIKIAESIGYLFKIEDFHIYSFKTYNRLLFKKLKFFLKHKDHCTKKVKRVIDLYQMLKVNDYHYIGFKTIFTSKDLLMAIYLYCIDEV